MDLMQLTATLGLDASGFEAGVRKSRGLFSSLGSTVGAGTVALGNLIATGVTKAFDALVDLGRESVQTGISFEAAMDKVAALSGTTGSKFDELVDKAMAMGASTKFSATESAEAFKYMAMAGWDADQMMAGIAGVMDLAAASGEDLAAVSDIVTDVLTAMGKSAGDAGQFADVLAAATSKSNTSVGLMGETFKYAAPLAGALGFSIEDLALATGLMANSGIKGSQAGTSLRSILTNLAKPTQKMENAMKKLGITMTESDGTMLSMREIMLDMRSAFSGLTESEQAQYAATIAGQEAMSGFLAIVNASEEDFNKLTEAVDMSAGTAKSMADIMMDNVGGSLEELGGAMETLSLNLFSMVKGPLRSAFDFAANVVNRLNTGFSESGWLGMATAAGNMLSTFATSVVESAPSAMMTAADAIVSALNAQFGLNIPSIEQILINPPTWEELSQQMTAWWSGIRTSMTTMMTWALGAFEPPAVAGIAQSIGTWWTDTAWPAISTFLTWSMGEFTKPNAESIALIIGTLWSEQVRPLLDGLLDWTLGAFTLPNIAQALLDLGAWWSESGRQSVVDALDWTLGTLVLPAAEALSDTILDWSGKLLTYIEEQLAWTLGALGLPAPGEIITQISTWWDGLVADVSKILVGAFSIDLPKIEDVTAQIMAWWDSVTASIGSFFIDIGTNLFGGREKKDGTHFAGLDYVPRDEYVATLHRGEAVLTRSEAEDWRADGMRAAPVFNVTVNVTSEPQTAADLMREARWAAETAYLRSGWGY